MNDLNRRKFVKKAVGLAGMTAFGGTFNAMAAPLNINALVNINSGGKINKIGLQLYTVRGLMRDNVEKTINQVAKIGYHEVEFAGYYGRSAKDLKNTLDQNGISSPSTHVALSTVQGDALKKTIEYSVVMGQKYIIVPFLNEKDRQSLDQYKAIADIFNVAGEECKNADIQFAYHNHDFEFRAIDGVMPYDILLDKTDNDLVKMQMDLYWIISAGGDPVHYFNKHPGRFPLCHVKDMTKAGKMVDVGHGDIDFATLFSHSEIAGMKHYIVEHDNPQKPLESIGNSFKSLQKMIIS